ncbi:ABC-type transport auxiliary lipoprotein family protein [Pseudomonas sp. LS44]|uniref:ABC-type transport auxiliary lipoprotein family protein n=1 Tax=Pseudomonas sp. LS44 TaxID=1357074 RepID=UPI00215A99C2|nr:ABC-type transport auxiliary lipoprotein family protein [Pseudomonas sp. LS44]UVE19450.1 ABC-type transport auxiliary lipoprotein family protein [Pseudomonas sp. LS44]
MTSALLRSLGLASATLLTSCSLLPQAETVQTYLLPHGAAQAPANRGAVPQSLSISRPQASLLLDSTRIAVVPQGSEISTYKGARWSNQTTALLRDRLLESFQNDGRFAAVSSDEQHVQADLSLVGNLMAFQSEYVNGKPQVVIRLDARLVRDATQRIIASRSFVIRQASQDAAVPAVVNAFGQASDQLAQQLIEWTAAQAKTLK